MALRDVGRSARMLRAVPLVNCRTASDTLVTHKCGGG